MLTHLPIRSTHPSIHPSACQLVCTTAETVRAEDDDAHAPVALATFPVASRQNLGTVHHTGTTFSPIHPSNSPPSNSFIHPPAFQLACTTAETARDEDATAASAALATFPVASRQNLGTIHHTGTTSSPIYPFDQLIHPSIHPSACQLVCTTAETARAEDAAAHAPLATSLVARRQNLGTVHHTGTTSSPIQIHRRSTHSSISLQSRVHLQERCINTTPLDPLLIHPHGSKA